MTSPPALLGRDDLLTRLRAATRDFAAVLAAGDLAAPVPGCPGWDLRALGDHVGNVHRWVTVAVEQGHPNTPGVVPPPGRDDLVAWYAATARELVLTLEATAPDAACWTLAEPRTAAFWVRRQVHETVLHGWDAQESQGVPDPIDEVVAADGVDEVLTMFLPRQVRKGRMAELDRAVALEASDTGMRWQVGPGTPVGTVTASTADLLLLLWRRRRSDHPGYLVDGDVPAVHDVLDRPLTP